MTQRAERAALAASVAATVSAMIATPLRPRGARSTLAVAVVGGLAGWSLSATAQRWGGRRALGALGAVAAVTGAVEQVGSRTGVPFGRYRYTGTLQPEVAGVPAAVPLAWFAMAVPARESAAALLGPGAGSGGAVACRAARVGLGAALLTAWDLFLDPQMTAEGYWAWAGAGRYRGIPLSNYAGWLATSAGVMGLLEVLLPPGGRPDPALVGEYAWVAVMSALGFALFFRDPVVALAGGLAMVPAAAGALRQVVAWPTS